jgi:antitoxin VapB
MPRRVKLFRNGINQAVRIPRDFELPGHDALLSRDGDSLILSPAPPLSLLGLLASLAPLDDDFPQVEDLPPDLVAL